MEADWILQKIYSEDTMRTLLFIQQVNENILFFIDDTIKGKGIEEVDLINFEKINTQSFLFLNTYFCFFLKAFWK